MLQSEAGYIDARPHIRQLEEIFLQRTAGPYIRVRSGQDADPPHAIGLLRAPRVATALHRRTWLRIFAVRCSLPCDPQVGVIHAMEGMIPRFERAVCDYFTLGARAAMLTATVKR